MPTMLKVTHSSAYKGKMKPAFPLPFRLSSLSLADEIIPPVFAGSREMQFHQRRQQRVFFILRLTIYSSPRDVEAFSTWVWAQNTQDSLQTTITPTATTSTVAVLNVVYFTKAIPTPNWALSKWRYSKGQLSIYEYCRIFLVCTECLQMYSTIYVMLTEERRGQCENLSP